MFAINNCFSTSNCNILFNPLTSQVFWCFASLVIRSYTGSARRFSQEPFHKKILNGLSSCPWCKFLISQWRPGQVWRWCSQGQGKRQEGQEQEQVSWAFWVDLLTCWEPVRNLLGVGKLWQCWMLGWVFVNFSHLLRPRSGLNPGEYLDSINNWSWFFWWVCGKVPWNRSQRFLRL